MLIFHSAPPVDGTCDGLRAGVVRVEMRMGVCWNNITNDARMGWKNSRQMTIMEIVPVSSACKIVLS